MADSFITKCPHCQVKFKLTESQINAAAGSVRCGACLNVFNAKNHLIEQAPKKAVQPKATPVKKEVELELQTESTEINFDFEPSEVKDDLSESLFADLDAQSDNSTSNNQAIDDHEDDISESLFSELDDLSTPDDTKAFNASDDSDDLNSLFEQTSEPNKTTDEQPSSDIDDINSLFEAESEPTNNAKQPDTDSTEDDFIFGVDEVSELEIDENFLNFDENIADAFTDDAIIAKEEIIEKIENPEDNQDDESWTKALIEEEPTKTENKAVFTSQNLGQSQPNKPTKNLQADEIKNKKQNAKNNVHQIEHDTHDLDSLLEKGSRSIVSVFAWSFLCVILLTGLAGQYIYYNFGFLAQSPWRPQLEKICEIASCQLPEKNTITQTISIEKFQVTEHPSLPNAVKILFVLRNSTTLDSEYPNVVIQIFDKNEKLIGDQSFAPAQYLPSQIKTDKTMRAKTDVQATITIKDLGTSARNYKVAL